MKKIKLVLVIMLVMGSGACNKDDAPKIVNPDPIGQPDPDPDPDPTPQNQAPGAFGLLQIPDMDTDVSRLPTLSWEQATDPDGDVVTYDVYVDVVSEPSVMVATDLTTTTYDIEGELDIIRTYYWRVVAKDGKGAETASETFQFTTEGFERVVAITESGDFTHVSKHESVVFEDKIWMLGGLVNSMAGPAASNEVWHSSDGKIWMSFIKTPGEKFTECFFHEALVFKDKMWVIGNADGFSNEVWSSEDGNQWQEITQISEFPVRGEHTVTVHNGKMYIIGGVTTGAVRLMDVWSSEDGSNWVEETSNPEFGPRSFHQVVSFKDNLWLIGGLSNDPGSAEKDVWNSVDGKTWTEVTTDGGFSERSGHRVLAFDDRLWLIGGVGAGQNDIWTSQDGASWEDVTPAESYPFRQNFSSVYFEGKIWIIAGENGNEIRDDVWVFE
ncbi:kelch repeat-containing protein [Maribacter sp. 2210JD10-5]|uniref:Kelch repeat-containing protein n=1 Tax=Maribacter sp. 2210JD10-5 TaxID=3386272 RepID=UPI0039BCD8B3